MVLLLLCLFGTAQETTLNRSVLFASDSYKLDKTEIQSKDKKGREYEFTGKLSAMKYSPQKNTYTVRRKQLRRLKETCKTAG